MTPIERLPTLTETDCYLLKWIAIDYADQKNIELAERVKGVIGEDVWNQMESQMGERYREMAVARGLLDT